MKLRGTTSKVQIDWECFDFLAPHLVSDKPKIFYEDVCEWLETTFSTNHGCQCCAKPDENDRCPWCFKAHGWHRCQHHCLREGLALNDAQGFRWKQHSLFNINDTDVERVFFDMLTASRPLKAIERVLLEQMASDAISQHRANKNYLSSQPKESTW